MPVAALAATVNLSVSRLRVLFKAETGLTIRQYVKRLRMQRAKELAGATFLHVSEIADLLKYNNASHFVRDFRRMFGVTPVVYRKTVNAGPEQSVHSLHSHLSY